MTSKNKTPVSRFDIDDGADDMNDATETAIKNYAAKQGIPDIQTPAAKPAAKKGGKVAAPAAPGQRFWVDFPEYVMRGLKMRIAQEGGTYRYHLLKALHESGAVDVDAADLVKDRRERGA